ncbi:MAG: hypothetical protein R3A48_21130 [Polyangiales bacterium]
MVLRVLVPVVVLGCEGVTVARGRDPARVEAAASALHGAGVPAVRVSDGAGASRLVVSPDRVGAAVEALTAGCTPGAEAPDAPSAPLLSAESDARSRRERVLSTRVAAALLSLPGVHRARVVVSLPAPAPFDADASPGPQALVVLLARGDLDEAERRARRVTLAAVPGLRGEALRVEIHPAPTAAPAALHAVGPFAVAAASARPLRLTLAALLTALAALSGALLRRTLRDAAGSR